MGLLKQVTFLTDQTQLNQIGAFKTTASLKIPMSLKTPYIGTLVAFFLPRWTRTLYICVCACAGGLRMSGLSLSWKF